jgi:hypothetical protein
MKHLKSSLSDLRHFFSHTITVRDIAEPLASFDADQEGKDVRAVLEKRNFDVAGVRHEGITVGFVRRTEIADGKLRRSMHDFADGSIVPDTAPLSVVFGSLGGHDPAFVTILGKVGAIVSRGDLQKAPVRMWLFSLVSLIEMQLVRLIRDHHPNDSWLPFVSPARVESAGRRHRDRQKRNEETQLIDCLQLCDKRDIMVKSTLLRQAVALGPKDDARNLLIEVEELRNDLAHANDIIRGRWPGMIDLVARMEALLGAMERAGERKSQGFS